MSEEFDEHIALFDSVRHDLRIFMSGIVQYVGEHPELQRASRPIVHSYKSRLKNEQHLRAKLSRKKEKKQDVAVERLFDEITDLAGVRFLHLYQDDFEKIDAIIRRKIGENDWYLSERPKAYTWDPENAEYFRKFDLQVVEKPTSYTSVHYLIRPRSDSPLCCELQVRTLFEEIWGEVDHEINYPTPTSSIACREQIKVLSKIVGAGSRLLDSLKRVNSSSEAQ